MLGLVLDDAIDMLERDAPRYASGMAGCLSSLPIGVDIDDEHFAIASDRERVRRVARSEHVMVEIRTTTTTMLRLLDGDLSLVDAIRRDDLRLRGAAESIHSLQDALGWFLLGCARCSGAPALLDRLRGDVRARTHEVTHG